MDNLSKESQAHKQSPAQTFTVEASVCETAFDRRQCANAFRNPCTLVHRMPMHTGMHKKKKIKKKHKQARVRPRAGAEFSLGIKALGALMCCHLS